MNVNDIVNEKEMAPTPSPSKRLRPDEQVLDEGDANDYRWPMQGIVNANAAPMRPDPPPATNKRNRRASMPKESDAAMEDSVEEQGQQAQPSSPARFTRSGRSGKSSKAARTATPKKPAKKAKARMRPPHESFTNDNDEPVCGFCQIPGTQRAVEGELMGPFKVAHGKEIYAHRQCITWTPEVYSDFPLDSEQHEWKDVDKAYKRARAKKCMHCKALGASVSCMYNGAACCRPMHFRCALMHSATLAVNDGFITLCHLHGRKPPSKAVKEPVPFELMLIRTPVPLHLLAKDSVVSCCDKDNFDLERGNVLHCGKCFNRVHSKCLAENFGWGGIFMNLAHEGKFRCKKCMECVECGQFIADADESVASTCNNCHHMKVHNACVEGDLRNGWRCDTCRSCYHCGYNVDKHSDWNEEHRACRECAAAVMDGNVICPSCSRVWREGIPSQTMIQCDGCDDWVHGDEQCSGLSPSEYAILDSSNKKYYCPTCIVKRKEKKRRDQLAKAIASKTKPKKRAPRARSGKEEEETQFVPIYASSDEEDGASFRLFDKYNPRSRRKNEPLPFTKMFATDASSYVGDASPHTELCVACCTSGAGASLRHCAGCGESYHGFCVDGKLPELSELPLVSTHAGTAHRFMGGGTGPNARQWLCPSCTTCMKCGRGDESKDVILCDHCDRGVHLACLSPPLEVAPEGAFFCEECRFCELCGKSVTTPTRVREHCFCGECAPVVEKAAPCRVCGKRYPEACGRIMERTPGQMNDSSSQLMERTGALCAGCGALTHTDCDGALEVSCDYRCPACRGVVPMDESGRIESVCEKTPETVSSDVSESIDEIVGNTLKMCMKKKVRKEEAVCERANGKTEVGVANGVKEEVDITGVDPYEYFDEDRVEWTVDSIDRRRCEMCHLGDNANPKVLGRLIPLPPDGVNSPIGFMWVHASCMLWCPGTTLMNDDGRYGILGPRKVVLQYAKSNVCSVCGKRGATVNCRVKNCHRVYHFSCAFQAGVMCHEDERVEAEGNATGIPTYCRVHAKKGATTLKAASARWDLRRQIRIVRLKEIATSSDGATCAPSALKDANAKEKTLVRVGGLTVISLGRLVPDTNNYILKGRLVPTGYRATRLFWSMKRPGKRVLYYFEVRGDVSWGPEFCVWNEEDVDDVIKGIDVYEVWRTVKRRVRSVTRDAQASASAVADADNGFAAFGLALKPVVTLIESMPMAWVFSHRYNFRYRTPVPKNPELAKRLLGTRGLHPGLEPPVNKTGCSRTEGYIPCRETYKDIYKDCPTYTNNNSGAMFQIGVAMESEGFEHLSPNTGTALGIGEWCRKSTVVSMDDRERTSRAMNNVSNKENLSTARKYRLMQDQHAKSKERKYQVLRSSVAGYGVFAKTDFQKGEYIIEYSGDEVRPIISDLREEKYISNREQLYFFSFNGEAWELENWGKGKGRKCRELRELLVVDATKSGNAARFINHSCNPNCLSKEIINDEGREAIVILAKKDILRGEELGYDYMLSEDGGKEEPDCRCGAVNCRGTMIVARKGEEEATGAAGAKK